MTTRNEVLDLAKEAINGERKDNYGDAKALHDRVGAGWSVILGHPVRGDQVVACLIMLKLLRAAHNPSHLDSYVDIAGYAALAPEIVGE